MSRPVLVLGSVFLLAVTTALGACASGGDGRALQSIHGQLDLAGFTSPVRSVRAMRGSSVTAEVRIGVDGSFNLLVPVGHRYRIVFVDQSGATPTLVYPRRSGSVDTSFRLHGQTAPIDLGLVSFIGDPAGRSLRCRDPEGGGDCACADTGGGGDGSGDDGSGDDGGGVTAIPDDVSVGDDGGADDSCSEADPTDDTGGDLPDTVAIAENNPAADVCGDPPADDGGDDDGSGGGSDQIP